MAQKDIKNTLAYQLGIVATISGATSGTALAIDTKGYEAVTLSVFTGTVTDAGTAAGIVWELQDSDDNSTYTAVSDDYLIGTEASLSILNDTDDNKYIGKLGYIGKKRYLKLIPTGSTLTDATVIAIATLGEPNNQAV